MSPRRTRDVAGSRYLALRRLARTQRRTTAEILQLDVLEGLSVTHRPLIHVVASVRTRLLQAAHTGKPWPEVAAWPASMTRDRRWSPPCVRAFRV